MKALEQQTPRPFTGRHMALILVAFFAVVVGVNVTMAVLARKSWTGLVVQNSYVASQHFNAETKKRLAMLEKGFRMEIVVRAGSVSVTLNDKAGLALPLHKATMTLVRSDWAFNDTSIAMQCRGSLCSSTAELAPGLWKGEAVLDVVDFGEWRQPVEVQVGEK
jgi:nitrogen fixation protein FixH